MQINLEGHGGAAPPGSSWFLLVLRFELLFTNYLLIMEKFPELLCW